MKTSSIPTVMIRFFLLFGLSLLLPLSALADLPKNFIPIGDPGNKPDSNGFGAVNYPYRILNKRITNNQYAYFLNKVDPLGENKLGLMTSRMETDERSGITLNKEAPEGKRYEVKEGFKERPILFVTWEAAARYTNWLSNGAKAEGETETGAYDLAASNGAVTRKSFGAPYWIPNEDEWYKAAYFRVEKGKAEYAKTPRWKDSIVDGQVTELVDASPNHTGRGVLSPVAENTNGEENGANDDPSLFNPPPVGERDTEEFPEGFRVATQNQLEGVVVAEEEPVGELVGNAADTQALYPVAIPGAPFGYMAFPMNTGIIVDNIEDEPEPPPAS